MTEMTDQLLERRADTEYYIERKPLLQNCSVFAFHRSIAEDIPDVPILLSIMALIINY